jgi:flagellar protein FlbD
VGINILNFPASHFPLLISSHLVTPNDEPQTTIDEMGERTMIAVKRLNDEEIFINPHLIEMIEATPDTVVTFTTGKRLVVKDSTAEMVAKIIQYRQLIGEKFFTDYDNGVL